MITEENRGHIRNLQAFRQEIDWTPLRVMFGGKITPTDIDGFVDLQGRTFIFFEFKLAGAQMTDGQELALRRLTDAIKGVNVLYVIAEHKCFNNDLPIDTDACTVTKYRYNGKWIDGKGRSLVDVVQSFLMYTERTRAHT